MEKNSDHAKAGITSVVSERHRKLQELWNIPIDLFEAGLIVKRYPFTTAGVHALLKDNSYNASDMKDILFGIIVVKLVDAGIIVPNHEDEPLLDKEIPLLISAYKLKEFAPLAKTMAIVALGAYSKSAIFNKEANSPYESFCNVKGHILSRDRYVKIVRMIGSSGTFTEIFKMITVGDIKAENDVLKYPLMRLSTPRLIKAALIEALPYKPILGRFDPIPVSRYKKFVRAGILAHVASGLFSCCCKGNIDVMELEEVNSIPDSTSLFELKAIKAPYDAKTIKRAYIILEEINFDFGRWYQGEKAMRFIDPEDMMFRAIVRMVFQLKRDEKHVDEFSN